MSLHISYSCFPLCRHSGSCGSGTSRDNFAKQASLFTVPVQSLLVLVLAFLLHARALFKRTVGAPTARLPAFLSTGRLRLQCPGVFWP